MKLRGSIGLTRHRAFTLVMSVAMLFLIALIALSMLGLSSIELRRSSQSQDQSRARANARLALMLALGNLQKQLGPDQRVSAPAAMENSTAHPHWTGVWSTVAEDGSAIWRRDDANGGLSDTRNTNRQQSVRRWLVSGNDLATQFTPTTALSEQNSITLVDRGSVGTQALPTDFVRAPLVTLTPVNGQRGRYAYWIGDEGIKANIATPQVYDGKRPNPQLPAEGGYFALLNSQESDAAALLGGQDLTEINKARTVSARQLDLATASNPSATRQSFHQTTTQSLGLQVNVRHGRLKRDLTAFIESAGPIPDLRNGSTLLVPGLSDTDNMVGPANANVAAAEGLTWTATRHRSTSPRFGLIREWARQRTTMSEGKLNAVTPSSEPQPRLVATADGASANLRPATIAAYQKTNLTPILVEGSTYFAVSSHDNPPGAARPYNVRLQTYPRVVLWNPYNVELTMDRSIIMLHVNGRQEMWSDEIRINPNGTQSVLNYNWIWFPGGRNKDFSSPNGGGTSNSEGYKDPYIGSFYFSLPRTRMGPGECLVFSTARLSEYNFTAMELNELSCEVSPDPSRCFMFTSSEINGGINHIPNTYWFAPTVAWNIRNQADDQRMILKSLGTARNVTPESFDYLPQIASVSCSLQYGGGREPRIAWAATGKEKMEFVPRVNPRPTQIPNVRTREGYRLRWYQEHPSNLINSGALRSSPFFEESLLATWNPRAAYATRSPWDNVGGALAVSGSGGGPWFFGIYTRDLYDQAVSWNDQMPVYRNGRYHGYPFGTPQEGRERIVLFDVPRDGVGVVSLGQLQHVKFSEFVWHPSYAVGNSLVDPRVASGPLRGINRTSPVLGRSELSTGGFDAFAIGWSSDVQRSTGTDDWARQGRALYQDYTNIDLLCYDLSYELNHTLWDDFFFSTGDSYAKRNFLNDPVGNPLPNGRMRLNPTTRSTVNESELLSLHQSARHLLLDGAFNVNSTSVAAWEALLRSSRGLMGNANDVAFPRILAPPGSDWRNGRPASQQNAWDGYRVLTDAEVRRLAEEIVRQVQLRGPFLSLADFVNRRLRDDETGRMGPLQAAIEAAGLNQTFRSTYPLNNRNPLPDYAHPDNIRDSTRLEQTLKPDSMAWGIPGYLTQADVLQVIGSSLTARSDTFRIRAYGEAADDNGVPRARAWCEAVVQRMPEPLRPDASGLNPLQPGSAGDFGRRFVIVSFRWLKPEEV
jgi:Tfp pilus assembly protein PilX